MALTRSGRRARIDPIASSPSPVSTYAIPTEVPNEATADLDLGTPRQILERLVAEDATVPGAVASALEAMTAALGRIVDALSSGRSVHVFGAGSSGRLAALDVEELGPTYGLEPGRYVAHVAGQGEPTGTAGNGAGEAAEDDAAAGERASSCLAAGDVALGVSASGRTPYVLAALRVARDRGASTVLLTCNPAAPAEVEADVHVVTPTGPEAITGSTRLKAGTAAKLVLNDLSTAAMVCLGRTFSHFMVYVADDNQKLRARSVRILEEVVGEPPERCAELLAAAGGEVATALTMALAGCDAPSARSALEAAGGAVRGALEVLSRAGGHDLRC